MIISGKASKNHLSDIIHDAIHHKWGIVLYKYFFKMFVGLLKLWSTFSKKQIWVPWTAISCEVRQIANWRHKWRHMSETGNGMGKVVFQSIYSIMLVTAVIKIGRMAKNSWLILSKTSLFALEMERGMKKAMCMWDIYLLVTDMYFYCLCSILGNKLNYLNYLNYLHLKAYM